MTSPPITGADLMDDKGPNPSSKGWANPTGTAKHGPILRAYIAGDRVADIAARFNITTQRVSVICRRNGLRRNKPRHDKVAADIPEKLTSFGLMSLAQRNKIILALLSPKRLTVQQVADLFNISYKSVSHVNSRYGAPKCPS